MRCFVGVGEAVGWDVALAVGLLVADDAVVVVALGLAASDAVVVVALGLAAGDAVLTISAVALDVTVSACQRMRVSCQAGLGIAPAWLHGGGSFGAPGSSTSGKVPSGVQLKMPHGGTSVTMIVAISWVIVAGSGTGEAMIVAGIGLAKADSTGLSDGSGVSATMVEITGSVLSVGTGEDGLLEAAVVEDAAGVMLVWLAGDGVLRELICVWSAGVVLTTFGGAVGHRPQPLMQRLNMIESSSSPHR